MDILVLGDSHAKHGVPNDRFTWAGRLAADRKPEVIVQIGDWGDWTSLCLQLKGKKSYEGKRYNQDKAVATDALKKFQQGLDEGKEEARRKKVKQYKPQQFITLGNHDNRPDRETELSPILEGTISSLDVPFEEYGWTTIPYLKPLRLNGMNFQHYFASGSMGQAISGENHGKSLITKKKMSCVVGHSHMLDLANQVTGDGRRLWGIVAGCYFEHSEDYTPQEIQDTWWRGAILLKQVKDGDCSPELITMEEIKRLYA